MIKTIIKCAYKRKKKNNNNAYIQTTTITRTNQLTTDEFVLLDRYPFSRKFFNFLLLLFVSFTLGMLLKLIIIFAGYIKRGRDATLVSLLVFLFLFLISFWKTKFRKFIVILLIWCKWIRIELDLEWFSYWQE